MVDGETMDMQPEIRQAPATEGSVARRIPDITALKQIGYCPSVSLKEGIRRTWEYYLSRLERKSGIAR